MKNHIFKKRVISSIAASALMFSLATPAFANEENTEQTDTNVVEEVIHVPAVIKETTEDEVTEKDVVKEVEETEQVDEKAPSLVPGDFFYFVKLMIEKVRLAATFDDYKEARLLAEFTAERIAEANALLAEGKTEEATDLLKEAIASQEKAAENLADSDEGTSEEAVATEDTTKTDEATENTEIVEETDEAEEIVVEEQEDVVEVKLANNIDALTAALVKVKNPKAQAALMKNIQKSFAKLDKKLAKLEKKESKHTAKTIDEIDGTENETTETTEETIVEQEEVVGKTEVVEEKEVQPVVASAVSKKEKAAKKIKEKHAHDQQVKATAKKEKAQAKRAEKQQKAHDKKQNNGHKNDKGNEK